MIHVWFHNQRDEHFCERVLLKSPKTLTETAQYARFAEAATRMAEHSPASSTTIIKAINPRGVSYSDAKHSGDRNQQHYQPRHNSGKSRLWQPGEGTRGAQNGHF